jgi:hypothetical protein
VRAYPGCCQSIHRSYLPPKMRWRGSQSLMLDRRLPRLVVVEPYHPRAQAVLLPPPVHGNRIHSPLSQCVSGASTLRLYPKGFPTIAVVSVSVIIIVLVRPNPLAPRPLPRLLFVSLGFVHGSILFRLAGQLGYDVDFDANQGRVRRVRVATRGRFEAFLYKDQRP